MPGNRDMEIDKWLWRGISWNPTKPTADPPPPPGTPRTILPSTSGDIRQNVWCTSYLKHKGGLVRGAKGVEIGGIVVRSLLSRFQM